MSQLHTSGSCGCGAVQFHAKGPQLFNALCHCRGCARVTGATPVHIIGIPREGFTLSQGEERVKRAEGRGQMTHLFCTECGTTLCREAESFVALFPPCFRIEMPDTSFQCGVSCKLPPELLPNRHYKYENRHRDWDDDLPKYLKYDNSARVKNNGYAIFETDHESAKDTSQGDTSCCVIL
uniref:CENP-V/GFA domain-containing protein n=1 Tax=Strombidinopsis acuminata TaxID=141414 RepID=A0A7S3U4F4_9SPIT|mmetsp:Transcript_26012/g.79088  ORF Transcript_26012/g.79088 Transcript_26012/m.79088 type:complete len:180 (-) Transcript_26012:533-1072(-)